MTQYFFNNPESGTCLIHGPVYDWLWSNELGDVNCFCGGFLEPLNSHIFCIKNRGILKIFAINPRLENTFLKLTDFLIFKL